MFQKLFRNGPVTLRKVANQDKGAAALAVLRTYAPWFSAPYGPGGQPNLRNFDPCEPAYAIQTPMMDAGITNSVLGSAPFPHGQPATEGLYELSTIYGNLNPNPSSQGGSSSVDYNSKGSL